MRTALLTFSVSLAALGLLGMVGHQGAGVPAPMPVVERGDHQFPIFPRLPMNASPDWTPTPQPGLSRELAPGESWKAPPVRAIHALTNVPVEHEVDAIRIAYCESGWDATKRIIDIDGLPREGAFMVGWWHGPVPTDIAGQAAQFARIVAEHGTYPFATRTGCPAWRKQ